MALTTEQRNALPDHHFAVPGKRRLPINDERHTKLAWDMVDRTKGIDDAEKKAARAHILRRASELGIDTSQWNKEVSASVGPMTISIAAMSLNLPDVDDHPNRMPFTGILMRLNEPSDAAPHGAGGRRTIMSTETARALLPSLLGMPIDFKTDFKGHNPKQKLGTLTAADIATDAKGDYVAIGGFFYAADFPEECDFIQAEKAELGFSYEIKAETQVAGALLKITGGKFTGAAVLYKNKAAYTSTSLAAKADQEFETMDAKELEALLAAALKPVVDGQTDLAKKVAALEAAKTTDMAANAEMRGKMKPHTDALRSCAASMEAAGIGLHATQGHVGVLNRMAASMDAEAASGKVPHVYRDHDWSLSHGGDVAALLAAALGKKPGEPDGKAPDTAAISAAVEAAIKPMKDALDAANTKITDLSAKAFKEAAPPERKTLSAEATALLTKADIKPDATTNKVGVRALDAACAKANLKTGESMALKIALSAANMLDNAA